MKVTENIKIIMKQNGIIFPLAGGIKGGMKLFFIPLLTSPARGGRVYCL